jgi:branched-chain amino acid transport system substrate-binding protein
MSDESSKLESQKKAAIQSFQEDQKSYKQSKKILVSRSDIDRQKLRRTLLGLSKKDVSIIRITNLGKKCSVLTGLSAVLILSCIFIPPYFSQSTTNPGINSNMPTSENQSFGDKILIDDEVEQNRDSFRGVGIQDQTCSSRIEEFKREKKIGSERMKARDYSNAFLAYQKAIGICKNAPETLVYLNNSRILKDKGNLPIYKLAVTVPTNQEMKNRALEMLRGFAHAQNEVNQGSEMRLQLHIFNDGNKAESAVKIATEIGKDESLLAVMGHWSSRVSTKVAEEYAKFKLTLITPISTTTKLKDEMNVFRLNTSTEVGGEQLGSYVLEKCKKKAYIISDGLDTYSDDLFNAIDKRIARDKDKSCSVESYKKGRELADDNFKIKKLAEQIEKGEVDILIIIPNPEQDNLKRALKILQTPEISRNRNRFLLVGDIANMQSPYFTTEGADLVRGMVMSLPYVVPDNSEQETLFSRSSKELWGTDVNWASAMSYETAQVLIQALRKSSSPTRENLQVELTKPDFSAKSVSREEIKFSPDDHIFSRTPYLVEVCSDNKSQKFSYRKQGCQ